MIDKLTKAERDTILVSLRQWLSYPAAREAHVIVTGGGKHRPLDNAEMERICKRTAKVVRKRDAAPLPHQSNNGARDRKDLKLRDDVRTTQNGDHLGLGEKERLSAILGNS